MVMYSADGAWEESSEAELTAAHNTVGSAQFLLTAAWFKVSSHSWAQNETKPM